MNNDKLSLLVKDVNIIGTASRIKQSVLERSGLQNFVDYNEKNYIDEIMKMSDNKGVDLILDPLGGKDILKNDALLKPLGRHILYGESIDFLDN